MSTSASQIKATMKYAKEKLKRIPLDMKKEEYEKFRIYTESKGISMRGFIIDAMNEKMKRDSE